MSTPTTTSSRSTGSPEESATSLFNDVRSTANAIERGDWLSAGLGATDVAMDIVGLGGDPLGAISSAGFGWLLQHVSFLREPFDVLLGDPNSITASASGWAGAASQLATTAASYETACVRDTGNWTGSAGEAYRTAGARQARGVDSMGQVSKAVSEAIRGAGQALAEIRKAVLDIINQACNKIVMIIIEALAASWGTFGTSIAKGIVQSVQTAVQAAQKAITKIQKLISTLQQIMRLVQQVIQLAQSVKELIEMIGAKATGTDATTPASGSPLDYGGTIADGVRVRELPPGVPSWGSSGPPPDAGYRASRVDQARWIGAAVQILIEHGVTPARIDPERIADIVNRASGGNPHAVNLDHPDARAGNPPKGLMQLTDPTFQRHHLPSHPNIYQPVDNLIAGMRHQLSTLDT
jgi:transglycosylase-like protein with SLT domain